MKWPFRRCADPAPTEADEALATSQQSLEDAKRQAREARPVLESLRRHQQENHVFDLIKQSIQGRA